MANSIAVTLIMYHNGSEQRKSVSWGLTYTRSAGESADIGMTHRRTKGCPLLHPLEPADQLLRKVLVGLRPQQARFGTDAFLHVVDVIDQELHVAADAGLEFRSELQFLVQE